MLGSKNDFFYQDKMMLRVHREDLSTYLNIKRIGTMDFYKILGAYDYFCDNPSQYDGETLVKDLCDIPNLSIAGMEHDYQYVVTKVWKNPIEKIKSDWAYGQRHEQLGRGWLVPYSRAILLIITTPFYYPIKLYTYLTN